MITRRAQIEAALKTYRAHYLQTADGRYKAMEAALTAAAQVGHILDDGIKDVKVMDCTYSSAAAEVGEPSTLDYAIGANFSLAQENEELRKELASTIERCAQVAERYAVNIGEIAYTMAAEIMALKDET